MFLLRIEDFPQLAGESFNPVGSCLLKRGRENIGQFIAQCNPVFYPALPIPFSSITTIH